MAQLNGIGFKHIDGAYYHTVINQAGERLGWIKEVFNDVFYVDYADVSRKIDTTRYRSMENALQSFKYL